MKHVLLVLVMLWLIIFSVGCKVVDVPDIFSSRTEYKSSEASSTYISHITEQDSCVTVHPSVKRKDTEYKSYTWSVVVKNTSAVTLYVPLVISVYPSNAVGDVTDAGQIRSADRMAVVEAYSKWEASGDFVFDKPIYIVAVEAKTGKVVLPAQ